MAVQLYPAYLLHRKPYSNSSLLVECLTPIHGRFPVIAKGVRSSRRSGTALLQPFVPLLIGLSGRGEVKTLTSFEPQVQALAMEGRTLYCGFYLNELLMRLLGRYDPNERVFYLYGDTLRRIGSTDNLEIALRRFEIGLLDELGYGLLFDQEAATGAPIDPDGRYHYELERGPIVARRKSSPVIRGSTLLALHEGAILDRIAQGEARELIRRALAHYLGGRPLKSRELFHSLRPSKQMKDPINNHKHYDNRMEE